MSRCRYTKDDAIRYHLGEMQEDERIAYAVHVEGCRECATTLAAQADIDRRIAGLPEYRPPRLERGVGAPVFTRWRPRRQRLMLAASLTALLAVGIVADRTRRDTREDRMVQAALAADARVFSLLPGRSASALPDDPLPPWLGFVMCDEWIASDPEGIYICALAPDGPLGRVGVSAGDVLLAVGGHPVASDTAMHRRLARHVAGDVIDVRIRRQHGGSERLRVRLDPRLIGERHPFDMDWSPALTASLDRVRPGGVDLRDVFASDSVPGTGRGLRVLMEPTMEQARRTVLMPLPHMFGPGRLRTGDLIVRLEDEPVAGVWDMLLALMRVQERTTFTLHVVRDGEPVAVTIHNPRGTEP